MQIIEDLQWLVEGHVLESDFDLSPYWCADLEQRLAKLRQDNQPLLDRIARTKSHFLGSYFEALFSFAIEQLTELKIIKEHFQIDQMGKTLGEVDMLVRLPTGEIHQFEIAIKFYLQRPDLAPNDWIGPNKNDSLHKKVTRARQHQLTLLSTSVGKQWLEQHNITSEVESNLLIFGRFYMALNNSRAIELWFAEEVLGGWIRASQFIQLQAYFSCFYVLQKPHWMSNPLEDANSTFFSRESAYNLVSLFLRDERPIHLFMLPSLGASKVSGKCIFVVPDHW
ncbi:DUF1853 family protein [Marinomonas sp. THO17]|uniref:DUF1853 family protein n=1 Tax=Marinomonas sp. THO17 TaxID=3149048 RepID=UPI00336BC878